MLVDPALVCRHDARPGPAAAAHYFSTLHRQIDIVAARITGHQPELGADRCVENFGKLIGVGRLARSADGQLVVLDLFQAGDAGRIPGNAHADLVIHAAEPIELGGIELRLGRAEQRIERSATADRAECRAVLGRDVVKPVREHEAAGAGHVFGNDRRIAGNETSHVPRQQTRIDVVAAAGAVADGEVDVFALVEVRRTLRLPSRAERKDRCRDVWDEAHQTHVGRLRITRYHLTT